MWNVNFPAMKEENPKGILWDRTVAASSMFRETYVESKLEDGMTVLHCKGYPAPDAAFAEDSDALAVRRGYISIGKVRCSGM